MAAERPTLSWQKNLKSAAIDRMSMRHDVTIDDFVQTRLRQKIRMSHNSDAALTIVKHDRVADGACEYWVSGVPERMSDLELEQFAQQAHCDSCSRSRRPCSAKVQQCTFQEHRQRCLVIRKVLPVPWTRGEIGRMLALMVLALVAIFVMRSSLRSLHTIWHGYQIPWLGIHL